MSRLKTIGALAVVGVAALALVGCAGTVEAPAQEEPQVDLAAEEQAIRQVNAKWLELYKAKDADGIGALFVADGWTLNAAEGLKDGREAIAAGAREDLEKNADALVEWGTKQVWVAASGDLAVERGWFTNDPDGEGDAEVITGEYLTVLTKVNGEWKVLADAGAPLGGLGTAD